MRPLYLVLIIAIIVLAGGGTWLGLAPSQKPSGFFDTKLDYDTSGGQPMRPRWKD